MVQSGGYTNHVSFDDLIPSFLAVGGRAPWAKQPIGQAILFSDPFLQVPGSKNRGEHKGSPSLDHYFGSKLSRGSSPNPLDCSIDGELLSPGLEYGQEAVNRSWCGSPSKFSPSAGASILAKHDHLTYDTIKDFDLMDLDPQKEHQMHSMTNKNTQENSGSSHGYTTSAFSNLNEVEDKVIRKDYSKQQPSANGARRKSFAGMSDAELAALEQKYEAASKTNYDVGQFDFGEQAARYIEPENNKIVGSGSQMPQSMYPSRPCVLHKALNRVKVHSAFAKYVVQHRKTEDKESLRTIVCVISGRRHTWSAVDWYVENLSLDGDHLVIVTRIPNFEEESNRNSTSQTTFVDGYDFKNDKSKNASLSRRSSNSDRGQSAAVVDIMARAKCDAILDYYLGKLNGKIMKISVELIKDDSTPSALSSAIALYKPDLKIVSTVSTNLHIKFRNGHVKLPNFVMRHFWVPTYVIPYEFIDPALLGEKMEKSRKAANFHQNMTDSEVTQSIDKIIFRTLKNPYGPQEAPKDDSPKTETDADAASVASYFPMDPETKRKLEEFERVGYLRPIPTRRETDLAKQPSHASSSKSSRRSSRVQFSGGDGTGMYKIKSLLDGDDKDGGAAKKTRSVASTLSNGKGPSSKQPSGARRTKSVDPTPATENKKKSGKLGGFLKKLGVGK
ncbi:LADA_0H19526g1_1 [Lachancea dasiensis]|uniref:LADA_0H19526g1_1 n=1 Tax=Lachancea dasiensis TaxID=1072105 RepID=A0A1G4K6B5_9SACH|nr:LADA_0H19526g1_1 [Lachancea dasiensis]